MAVSSGGTQGVGDVWVAAAPKGGPLISSRGWRGLPAFLCCQKSGPRASAGLGISLSPLKGPGEGPTGAFLIKILLHPPYRDGSQHMAPMLPGRIHRGGHGGYRQSSPGDLPAGLRLGVCCRGGLGRPGVGSMPLPQPLHLRSLVPGW